MIIKPGFYKLTDEQYFSDPAVDYTFLSKFVRSGIHAFIQKVTPSMIFGSAFHWAILEPKRYVKYVKTKNSGYPEIDGQNILLKPHDKQAIKEMKYNLWKKKQHAISSKMPMPKNSVDSFSFGQGKWQK